MSATEDEGEERDIAESLMEQWLTFPPSVQAASEGRIVSLSLLLGRAVELARRCRVNLRGIDPSLESVMMVVVLSNVFRKTIEPEPTEDVVEVLAAAAVRIMHLEDRLAEFEDPSPIPLETEEGDATD